MISSQTCNKCLEDLDIECFSTYRYKGKQYTRKVCIDCLSTGNKLWQKLNKKKLAEQARARSFKALYGITIEDYDKMFEDQKGLCRLCELPHPKTLAVDHCHITNKIRGLLCRECNLMLGYTKDNVELLQKAITYLNGN